MGTTWHQELGCQCQGCWARALVYKMRPLAATTVSLSGAEGWHTEGFSKGSFRVCMWNIQDYGVVAASLPEYLVLESCFLLEPGQYALFTS